MERILKIFIIFVMIIGQFSLTTKAESLLFSQNIPYENCTKVFNIDNLNLFYLTVSSINTNKFTINEIQTKSGYILFTAVGRKYLASVINVNTNQAMLKITPTDNNYNFQPGILTNMFEHITNNIKTKPEDIFTN